MKDFKVGDFVTASPNNSQVYGVFELSQILGDIALLKHPLSGELMIAYPLKELDNHLVDIMSSEERSLYFLKTRENLFDFETIQHLKALSLYYVITRRLTRRMMKIIGDMLGQVARIELNNHLAAAKDLVRENRGVLDEFNEAWFHNFSKVFSGDKRTTDRVRKAIFNMAGFVMSELSQISSSVVTRGVDNGEV